MSRGNKPTPGRVWTADEDTDLETVATQAYGDPTKAPTIWGANKGRTSSVVRKGESLIIPGSILTSSKIGGKRPDELTVIISGIEIGLTDARVIRTMDTAADGWSGTMPWRPGENPELDKALLPYSYARSSVYIGGELQVNGHLYTVRPGLTAGGRVKELIGFSHTIDMVDSHVQPPYERSNVTLEQLAREMMNHRGIRPIFKVPSGGPFARVTGHESDTVFSHLSKLATERGILVSCDEQGNMVFHRAVTEGAPVGTIVEGESGVEVYQAEYDGRKRFNVYRCISAGANNAIPQWGQEGVKRAPAPIVEEVDPKVPLSRFLSFRADDTTPGNAETAARWRRNKQFVETMTQDIRVTTWFAPNGKLWSTNTLITLVSPTLSVPNGFTFCIRAVEFSIGNNGRTAVLSLVPPQAYTGKEIGDIWS